MSRENDDNGIEDLDDKFPSSDDEEEDEMVRANVDFLATLPHELSLKHGQVRT